MYTKFINWNILLAFYYLWYRYPLQYNAASTSFSYRNTPFEFAIGKYIIFILLLYIFAILTLDRSWLVNFRFKPKDLFYFPLILFMAIWPCFVGIVSSSLYLVEIGIFFFLPALFILMRTNDTIDQKKIASLFKTFLFVSIFVNFLQVILFFKFGRLPALAYPGSILVRFGSLWDDPNGFSIMLAFLIPFTWILYKGKLILLLTITLFLCLLATQSLTGIVSFIIAILGTQLLLIIATSKKKYYISFTIIMLVTMVISTIIFQIYHSNDAVGIFIEAKSGSIEAHRSGAIEMINTASVLNILGLSPIGIHSEFGWLNILYNLGLFYTLIYVGIIANAILTFLISFKQEKNTGKRAFQYGAMVFLLSFTFALFNLPLEAVFPINYLIAILLVIAHMEANRKDNRKLRLGETIDYH